MDQRTPRSLKRAARAALGVTLVALALAGCGGGGSGEGTATSAVESTAAITESPTPAVNLSSPVHGTSPAIENSATPGAATPTPAIVVSAPPVTIPTPRPSGATPAGSTVPPTPVVATASVTFGDGTGGAMAEAGIPAGTPSASPVAQAAETVTSCDVTDYPPYTGSDPVQVTTIDVNFRAGPGTDCDPIGEPIGAGVAVEILSDPVRREGDEFIWVAVTLDGTQGWLATDFLEPAP